MYLKITIQLDSRSLCIEIENMDWTSRQTRCENYIVVNMF